MNFKDKNSPIPSLYLWSNLHRTVLHKCYTNMSAPYKNGNMGKQKYLEQRLSTSVMGLFCGTWSPTNPLENLC